jgi:hypothetical protein
VRTARLVAVTVARRIGWPESVLESVRQAVGEACALALRSTDSDGTISLELDDEGSGLTAWVSPVEASTDDEGAELPWAVLDGLTHEATLERRDGAGVLRLRWTA